MRVQQCKARGDPHPKTAFDDKRLALIEFKSVNETYVWVMDLASGLMDGIGPRLTGSPNIKAAGDWAVKNNIKKVVTLVSDYAPGHDAETSFSERFKANGGENFAAIPCLNDSAGGMAVMAATSLPASAPSQAPSTG